MSSQPCPSSSDEVRDVDRRRRVVRVPLRMDDLLGRDGRVRERAVDRLEPAATHRAREMNRNPSSYDHDCSRWMNGGMPSVETSCVGRLDPDLHLLDRREERLCPPQHEERGVALDERDVRRELLVATLGAEHVEPLEPEALVVDRVRELVGEGDPVERRGRFGAHELQLAR